MLFAQPGPLRCEYFEFDKHLTKVDEVVLNVLQVAGWPTSSGGGGADDRRWIASPDDRPASVPVHLQHRFIPELVVAITAPRPIRGAID